MAARNSQPANKNTEHVDMAQRQQAMEFLQKMMAGKGGYTPIVKTLSTIGVEVKTVAAGEDLPEEWHGEELLVIRVSDLMMKEWKHMSEIDQVTGA